MLELRGDRDHIAVDEVADGSDDLTLLRREPERAHAWAISSSWSGARTAVRSSCSSSERTASSSAATPASGRASDAFSRNFSRTSSAESGFSGPPFW